MSKISFADHDRRVAMERDGKLFSNSFLEHCVVATSQYQDIVAAMAAEILRLRAELVDQQACTVKATQMQIDAEDALAELQRIRLRYPGEAFRPQRKP